MVSSFVISQIVVFFAMLFDIASFQFKERKKILIFMACSTTLISTHYFFLGRTTAGIITGIAAIRLITGYFSTNIKFIYLFLTVNTAILILTYSSIYDLFIYLGVCFITIGSFQHEDKMLRLFVMCGTTLILTYNLIIFSPVGAIAEFNFLITNIVGYYRFYIKNNKKR